MDSDAATGEHRPPRLEASDPSTSQPDEVDAGRAIEQLGRERRDRFPWRVLDCAEASGDEGKVAPRQGADRYRRTLLDIGHQFGGVQRLQIRRESAQQRQASHGF